MERQAHVGKMTLMDLSSFMQIDPFIHSFGNAWFCKMICRVINLTWHTWYDAQKRHWTSSPLTSIQPRKEFNCMDSEKFTKRRKDDFTVATVTFDSTWSSWDQYHELIRISEPCSLRPAKHLCKLLPRHKSQLQVLINWGPFQMTLRSMRLVERLVRMGNIKWRFAKLVKCYVSFTFPLFLEKLKSLWIYEILRVTYPSLFNNPNAPSTYEVLSIIHRCFYSVLCIM